MTKNSYLVSNPAPSVISVHSWVSFGHVGHGIAAFTLMRSGIRVTMLPCVLYTNSLSYEHWRGAPLDAKFVDELCEGIKLQPEFTSNSALWTGFLGTPECAKSTLNLLKTLRNQKGCDVPYFCDPVLGDGGKLYLPEPMVAVYQKELLNFATVILPNRFELGWLTNSPEPKSLNEAFSLASKLLEKYTSLQAVIVTGINDSSHPDRLFVLFYPKEGTPRVVSVKCFNRHFAGAGDLFSGIFTSFSVKGSSFEDAFYHAAGRTAAVIEATYESKNYELRIIENQFVLDADFECDNFFQKHPELINNIS